MHSAGSLQFVDALRLSVLHRVASTAASAKL